jgi:hypothetical protein
MTRLARAGETRTTKATRMIAHFMAPLPSPLELERLDEPPDPGNRPTCRHHGGRSTFKTPITAPRRLGSCHTWRSRSTASCQAWLRRGDGARSEAVSVQEPFRRHSASPRDPVERGRPGGLAALIGNHGVSGDAHPLTERLLGQSQSAPHRGDPGGENACIEDSIVIDQALSSSPTYRRSISRPSSTAWMGFA